MFDGEICWEVGTLTSQVIFDGRKNIDSHHRLNNITGERLCRNLSTPFFFLPFFLVFFGGGGF